MVPSRLRVAKVPAVFRAHDGSEIARLEKRPFSKVALIGVPCIGKVTLTAPLTVKNGAAHINMCGKNGTCRNEEGISLCVSVVASLHNRGVPIVHSAGYGSVILITGAEAEMGCATLPDLGKLTIGCSAERSRKLKGAITSSKQV